MARVAGKFTLAAILSAAIASSGCFGGGGSGDSPPFSSATGQFRSVAYQSSGDSFRITGSTDAATTNATLRFRSNNERINAITLPVDGSPTLSGHGSVEVDGAFVSAFARIEDVPETPTDAASVRIRDVAIGSQLEHVTYGAWATGLDDMGDSSGSLGAGAFGDATSPDAAGNATATYEGRTTGILIEEGVGFHLTSSVFTAEVDFGGRTIEYDATEAYKSRNLLESTLTAPDDIKFESESDSNLEFSGIATIMGDGAFVHNDPSNNHHLSGSFYGPQARLIGGTFSRETDNGLRYFGSFGGEENPHSTGSP